MRHISKLLICFFVLLLLPFGGSARAVLFEKNDSTFSQDFNKKYVKDELLVKFKEGVPDNYKKNLHQKYGSKKIKEFKRFKIHHVKIKKDQSIEEVLEKYLSDPDVEYAEQNFVMTSSRYPNDPLYYELWGLHSAGTAGIRAPEAWDYSTGSASVVVAVIDSGLEYSHQDIYENIWINEDEIASNGIDDDGNGYVDDQYGIDTYYHDSNPIDDNGHGTHVSGTIGAKGDNNVGVVGVNWDVKIMPCKFLNAGGSGYTSGVLECLEYVKDMRDRGVNVVATNNSYGCRNCYSQALADAIQDQGEILFIAAAGNDGCDTDQEPEYPASYALPNVISVAATDYNSDLASWALEPEGCSPGSNYGRRSVHVGAPGVDILSTYVGNTYESFSGTSMAAPHVSGLAALIKAQDPNRNWAEIRNLILSGGISFPSLLGNKTITGKKIYAKGSLTCSNRQLFSVLSYETPLIVGSPTTLSALSINCDMPVGPVTVTIGGQIIDLADDGGAPDLAADDGIFSGTWVPMSSDVEILTFSSPIGEETVTAPSMRIENIEVMPTATLLETTAFASANKFFSLSFTTTGGAAPQHWTLDSGALPDSLTLNHSNGNISGIPTTKGIFSFTVQVSDYIGMQIWKDLTIIVDENFRPGWPKELEKRPMEWYGLGQSPIIADLDRDGTDEIIVIDDDSPDSTLYIVSDSGADRQVTLTDTVTTPAVADLDQDGDLEILLLQGWPALGPSLYAFHHDLTPVVGFPTGSYPTYNNSVGFVDAPVIADLDGDGDVEVIVIISPNNTNDPNYHKYILMVIEADGQMRPGWPQIIGTNEYGVPGIDALPTVGDLDGDGYKEIITAASDGILRIFRADGTEMTQWSFNETGHNVSHPVIADVDGDGMLDIVMHYHTIHQDLVTNYFNIDVFSSTGTRLEGWPQQFLGYFDHRFVVGDLDSDGRPEIIFNADMEGGDGTLELHALRYDGTSLPGWPLYVSNHWVDTRCSPVIGDVDADGRMEILQNIYKPKINGFGGDGELMIAHWDGTTVSAEYHYLTPYATARSAPALGDIDGNGRVDIFVKNGDGILFGWEMEELNATPPQFEWPMFRHDYYNSGVLGYSTSYALPYGYTGTMFEFMLPENTGIPPYTWSLVAGSLPAGLSLNPLTGVISGIPETTGIFSLTFQIVDTHGYTETRSYLLQILGPLAITTPSLSSGTISSPYSDIFSASGGLEPYMWSIISGSLPGGLSLNATSGVISGVPYSEGTFNFTVQAIDALAYSTASQFSLIIESCPLDPVRIAGATPEFYISLQSAYNAASDGDIIEAQVAAGIFENIQLNRPLSIVLQGGYDCGYNESYVALSTVSSLTISNGTVIVENINIQ